MPHGLHFNMNNQLLDNTHILITLPSPLLILPFTKYR